MKKLKIMGITYYATLIFGATADWDEMLKLIRLFDSDTSEEDLRDLAIEGHLFIPNTKIFIKLYDCGEMCWVVLREFETSQYSGYQVDVVPPSIQDIENFQQVLTSYSFPGTYQSRLYLTG